MNALVYPDIAGALVQVLPDVPSALERRAGADNVLCAELPQPPDLPTHEQQVESPILL